jgi:hydrogenase nickel incorporation protein HypB
MLRDIKVIELKQTILSDNDADADALREELKKQGIFYVNLMSSPGSGKTTTLLATLKRLKKHVHPGVMEADIDSDVDARTISAAGYPSVQLHTGGMCHLDAEMSRQGLRELAKDEVDFVFLENVGNLVCPAEFDTGAQLKAVILSVPEGDDKPLKYPLMFQEADVVLINKIDASPVFDFDLKKAKESIHKRNENARVFPISAMTGEGVDEWVNWLLETYQNWKAEA